MCAGSAVCRQGQDSEGRRGGCCGEASQRAEIDLIGDQRGRDGMGCVRWLDAG